jgi:hypothetical protein
MKKIDGLMGEANREIQDHYKKSRKETMVVATMVVVLIGLFVAIKLIGR